MDVDKRKSCFESSTDLLRSVGGIRIKTAAQPLWSAATPLPLSRPHGCCCILVTCFADVRAETVSPLSKALRAHFCGVAALECGNTVTAFASAWLLLRTVDVLCGCKSGDGVSALQSASRTFLRRSRFGVREHRYRFRVRMVAVAYW